MRSPSLKAALLVCLAASWMPAQQVCPPGKALVIGNSKYQDTDPSPASAPTAQAVAERLRALQFTVTEAPDATSDQMNDSIKTFIRNLRPTDIGIFFYSGYIIQYKGENYFLPINFHRDQPIEQQAMSLLYLRGQWEHYPAAAKLVILDAWQNTALDTLYPLAGLAVVPLSAGTLIAYPSPSNRVTLGMTSAPSPFARYLIETLMTPGLTPLAAMNHVVERVGKESQQRQVGVLTASISSECYMTGPPPISEEAKRLKELEAQQKRTEEQARIEKEEKQKLEAQLKAASELKPGQIQKGPTDNQYYVWIPSGTFEMGCVPGDAKCAKDESPRHTVTISKGFWMGQSEVQVSTYKAYSSRGGSRMPKSSDFNKK